MSSQIVKNKKAYFDYEILETFEAGIVLVGTEVKSLRLGKVKLVDAFCQINDKMELELLQMEIAPYSHGNRTNHEISRYRKLLMHKNQIRRLFQTMRLKGLTLVPLSMYFKRGKVKVELGLARGKKLHDKRSVLKEKDALREIDRSVKIKV